MPEKRDLYAECNVDGAPSEVFMAECCARCFNGDCHRAKLANGKFESRVSTWKERLFLNVPRMPGDDPRFPKLAGQAFMDIPFERRTSVAVPSTWHDPRELSATPEAPQTPEVVAPPAPLVGPAQVEAVPSLPVVSTPVAAPTPRPASAARLNTTFQSGKMLNGAPATAAPSDAWAAPIPAPAPAPTNPEERVVPRGAKIKLTGG